MNYTSDTKVKFYASIGFAGESREEIFTLGDLGWDDDSLANITEEEFEKSMEESHDDWIANFADFGWRMI